MASAFGNFKYTSLPARAQLRVAVHPDVKNEWCGFGPDTYKLPVFVRGIFHEAHMGAVTNMVNELVEPWVQLFYEQNPEAFLGDGFRHTESGFPHPEKDSEVLAAGEALGPVSAPPINIITETDRTIEKWKVRVGWTLHIFGTYFKDYSTFSEFMKLLEGNMTRGINKSLALIIKAVMCADPSEVVFGEKEFARIYGRTTDNIKPQSPVPAGEKATLPTRSASGREWINLMREVIEKYYGKSVLRWPNIRHYNPTFYSFNHEVEMMHKGLLYEEPKAGVDRAKKQVQQLYTDAHTRPDEDSDVTKYNFNTWRVDCLIALTYTLINALNKMTKEVTTEMWLGNETFMEQGQTKEGAETLRERLTKQSLSVDGRAVTGNEDGYFSNLDTSSSYNDGFEVCAKPEDIVIFLNPEDYSELEMGVARRGQMDVREVSLAQLLAKCPNIYPMRGMKPGFARVIDKRAFKIMPYFELTDIATPGEKLAFRAITHFHFAIVMFNLFAGFLLVPSPHFVASPEYYDKYGLIGQEIEGKNE